MRDLLVLAIAALSVGCTGASARRGETVVFASGADLQGMNSLLTTHPLAKQVQRHVLLTTLVRRDTAMNIEPYLARSWTWSADSLTLWMAIFDGLRWHDGAPTSARDAEWTLDAARDPAVGYPRQGELRELERVHAVDDTTLRLEFTVKQHAIPDVLTDLAILPRHLLQGVPAARLREAPWNRRPVGNGPFRFGTHETNRRWVFEADSSFPLELGGPPRIRRLVIAVVDEPTTKLAALASGELDFAGINPAHASFVKRRPELAVIDYPLLFTYVLVFNTRRPPLDDPALRRAMAMAIDRESIVAGYLFGFGTPAGSAVPPPLPGAAATAARSNPDAAIDLVAGRSPEIELLTVGSGDASLEQMIQSQLSRIGVTVRIRQLELTSFLDRVHGARRDFDVAVMGVSGDPSLGHLAPLVEISGLTAPSSKDDLLRMIDASLPVTFLYHARGLQGMNRRVTGVHMDMRGELASILSWTVE